MAKRRDSPLISTSTADGNSSCSAEYPESGIESDRGYAEVLIQQPHQNGRLSNTRSTESMLSRAASPDYQQHRKNYEYKQMEAKNKSQQRIFYTLVVLCFLVTLAYIAVIVFLLAAHSQMNLDSSPGPTKTATAQGQPSGQSDPQKYPYCVVESDISVHADLYRHMSYLKADKDNICFNSLEWFPKLVFRVNTSIQDRAAMVEDKHKKMSVDLDRIDTSFNRTPNTLTKLGVPALSPGDMSSRRYPVFAHLYLDNTADHSDALKWKRDGVDESSKERVNVNRLTGEVIVRESGTYFVYSHVTFNKNYGSISHQHQVVKNLRSRNVREVLLETDQGPASVLQGVFRLMVNDTLSVLASHDQLNKDSGRLTYFGTYLMRT